MGIGPFTECCLDEALGLAVGLRCVRLGADVFDAEVSTGIAERESLITTAIVSHDARNSDAEAFVIGDGGLEKGDGAIGFFIRFDLGESNAGMVVNADVDELPADAAAIALAGSIAGDAMAYLVETPKLFDIDVDDLTRCGAFITTHRLSRLKVAYPV